MKLSFTKEGSIGTLGCGWTTNVNTHAKAYELAVKLQPLKLELTLQSIKQAVDDGEFDRLLEEQLAYGSHLKKYL